MKSSETVDLCNGPLFKKMIVFTIPVIFSSLLQLLFNAVDMIVVGRFCGSNSLAAVGTTASLTSLLVSMFLGLSVGSSVAISHAIGAGNKKEIDRILHTSILTAVYVGIILTVIGLIATKPLLNAISTPSEIIDKSVLYLRIIFIGMPINMLYNFCAGMLRSAGDSVRPLIYLSIGGIANFIINVILVTIIRLDVAGVAIGTVVSQLISVLLILRQLLRGTEHLKLVRRKLHLSKPHFLKILKIGIPAGINGVAFSLSNILIQSSINLFGPIVIAANSAAVSIEGFTNSFTDISQTSITFTGQNMGAKKYNRIMKIIFTTSAFSITVALILGFIMVTYGKELLSIYCPNNPQALIYGMVRLEIMAFCLIITAVLHTTGGALRGMGYSFLSMVITLIGILVVRMTWLMLVFNQNKTLTNLYLSYPISQGFIAIANIIALFIVFKKLKK